MLESFLFIFHGYTDLWFGNYCITAKLISLTIHNSLLASL